MGVAGENFTSIHDRQIVVVHLPNNFVMFRLECKYENLLLPGLRMICRKQLRRRALLFSNGTELLGEWSGGWVFLFLRPIGDHI